MHLQSEGLLVVVPHHKASGLLLLAEQKLWRGCEHDANAEFVPVALAFAGVDL